MIPANIVTGLDVGTTKVCAIIAELSRESPPNVVGIGISSCTGLQRGTVVDIEATTEAIHKAVRKAERMSGKTADTVLLGVTGQHIASFNSRSAVAISDPSPREISQRDVERLTESSKIIVLPPDREVVHAIPRWYAVDGERGIRTPVGMYGSRLEIESHVVTGLSSFISNVIKCVQAVGLEVEATILQPIATGESVLLEEEKELGVAMVDIGGGTSDLAIYLDGSVYYSGVIPVGGTHVTKDIAVGLCAAQDEAERVKIRHGCALAELVDQKNTFEIVSLGRPEPRVLPRRVLAEIIEPRMTELCELIVEHVEKAGCSDRLPAGIVFTGGSSQIAGLIELASRVIGLPGRIGKPRGVVSSVQEIDSPSCATAVGLLLFGQRHYTEMLSVGAYGNTLLARIVRSFKEFLAKVGGD